MLAAKAARCCSVPLTAFVSTFGRTGATKLIPNKPCLTTRVQLYATESRHAFRRQAARSRDLKDTFMYPSGDKVFPFTAYQIGRGFLAGASVLGIGSLCYYGLGLSNEMGAIDRSMLWPEEVRRRIQNTYMYFGGSIAITALSAVAVSRNPALLGAMMKNSWMAIGATFAAMIGSGMLVRSIPFNGHFGAKQVAWVVHSGIMGAVVAPLCFLGGPVLMRAAWYTAGVVGGLSLVAMCAPSEKFLNMGGPLAIGLGLVFASSLGTMFLPPTTALGASMYSISVYGGLVLFGMFLLYDTQRIIKYAETYPSYEERPYDPVNASISIYLDTVNIFIRIAMMLAGGGGGRRK